MIKYSVPAGWHWSAPILTMKLWKMALFAQIWLKKATTPAILFILFYLKYLWWTPRHKTL
jgi:hypothetical protein